MKQKNYFLSFFVVCLFLIGTAKAQFKFGLGGGYSGVFGSENYNDKFPTHGLTSDLEFGYLIKDHVEPGLRLGFNYQANPNATKTSNRVGDMDFPNLYNLTVMPYLRYYFLESVAFRPYLVGAFGYSYNSTDIITYSQPILGNANLDYKASGFGGRLGAGVRLIKFLDLSLSYAYLGNLKREFTAAGGVGQNIPETTEDLFNASGGDVYKNKYHLHALELQLNFVFGGNLKKKDKKDKVE